CAAEEISSPAFRYRAVSSMLSFFGFSPHPRKKPRIIIIKMYFFIAVIFSAKKPDYVRFSPVMIAFLQYYFSRRCFIKQYFRKIGFYFFRIIQHPDVFRTTGKRIFLLIADVVFTEPFQDQISAAFQKTGQPTVVQRPDIR